jgi:hypothetical protein
MALVHEFLQAAASLALKGQQEVLQGVPECSDDAHREALVKASGLFNKLAQEIYTLLGRLERDDDDDTDTDNAYTD